MARDPSGQMNTLRDDSKFQRAHYDDTDAMVLGRTFAKAMGLKVKRQGDATFRWQCDDRTSAFHDKTSIGIWRTVERLAQSVVLGDTEDIKKVLGSS